MRHSPREVPPFRLAAQTWTLRGVLVMMAAIICALSLLISMAKAPLLEENRALKEQLALSQSQPDPNWKMVGWYRGEDAWPKVASGGSQAGQDHTVLEIFGGKREGFFVDLVANDASYISNSVMLEQVYGLGCRETRNPKP